MNHNEEKGYGKSNEKGIHHQQPEHNRIPCPDMIFCHAVDRPCKIGNENPELHMLVQIWRRGRSDQARIGDNIIQSPGALPPIDTVQYGVAETGTNKEEDQEQEQQSWAWHTRWWPNRTR